MLYRQEDMPFTKDGIVPDLIMNPHAIPSRMTIGQLIEVIMGKACLHLGTYGDSTPFTDVSVEEVADILEGCGMERYGNEIMYNSRTGRQMETLIFIGPTYYQRLKHMTADKLHCTTEDHDVLTLDSGWKPIKEVTTEDRVACLKDGKLVYEKPIQVFHFPDYKGKMYAIKSQQIDLDVTSNHRMFVARRAHEKVNGKYKEFWEPHKLIRAECIVGERVKYKKDAEWDAPDFQFVLPAIDGYEEKVLDMDSWIKFFGIWIAEGWATESSNSNYAVTISINKQRVKNVLFEIMPILDYKYYVEKKDEKMYIRNKQLFMYMKPLSVGAPNKKLPDWVWKLSKRQSQLLVEHMVKGDGSYANSGSWSYYTSSEQLADQFMQLCLHAGWSANKNVAKEAGNSVYFAAEDRYITSQHINWRMSVVKSKNTPCVNHGHVNEQEVQEEKIYDYEGAVYCLQVPSEVFYVRRNGKAVWTGNSRANNGPLVSLTRQPSEGRAREGCRTSLSKRSKALASSGVIQKYS